ncbi:splicing factor 3B subunit 1-like [Dorcoceras hygrometricum]|uniref:Splicing factor 3B subunit 1-like n=1 Tax=Dorcoceras hygrometricum TaxID=472368 RepID=A0A2Z7ACL7_9LAMI|nr:splicing factor 3B subunit 1-like [Dorcoceras hygrometricum]
MASSLISNTLQVDFKSVLGFPEAGMAAMFKALESSGLRGFLGCSSGIYEADLVAFLQNALAGSFDAMTHERFLLMTAIHYGLKINWRSTRLVLCEAKPFPSLKVLNAKTVGTYVARKKGIDDGNEGDEPVMATAAVVKKKPVTKKRPAATADEPAVKKKRTLVGRASPADKNLALVTVEQERPAATADEPAVKKKRTLVGRASPADKNLALVTVEQERRAPKRKLKMPAGSNDEIVEKVPDVENFVKKDPEQIPVVDEVDNIIEQVLAEMAQMETDLYEPAVTRFDDVADDNIERSIAVNDEDDNLDGDENEIARKMAPFTAPKQFLKEPLRSGEDDDLLGLRTVLDVLQTQNEIRYFLEHCDVLSMQMDSDLVIYRTTLVRTFQVVTICRVDKSEVFVVLISPHYSKRH